MRKRARTYIHRSARADLLLARNSKLINRLRRSAMGGKRSFDNLISSLQSMRRIQSPVNTVSFFPPLGGAVLTPCFRSRREGDAAPSPQRPNSLRARPAGYPQVSGQGPANAPLRGALRVGDFPPGTPAFPPSLAPRRRCRVAVVNSNPAPKKEGFRHAQDDDKNRPHAGGNRQIHCCTGNRHPPLEKSRGTPEPFPKNRFDQTAKPTKA